MTEAIPSLWSKWSTQERPSYRNYKRYNVFEQERPRFGLDFVRLTPNYRVITITNDEFECD